MGFTAQFKFNDFHQERWDDLLAGLTRERVLFKRKAVGFMLVELAGHMFHLIDYKPQGYYLLQSSCLRIQFDPVTENRNPTYMVEMYAYGVWLMGEERLMELAIQVADELGRSASSNPSINLYRSDFHVDAHVEKFDFTKKQILARGVKNDKEGEDGEDQSVNVGERKKDRIYVRLYNKTIQIATKPEHAWNQEVLESYSNYNPILPVVRWENQIGGGWLKGYGAREYEQFKAKRTALAYHLVDGRYQIADRPIERDSVNRHTTRGLVHHELWREIKSFVQEGGCSEAWSGFRVVKPPLVIALVEQNAYNRSNAAYMSWASMRRACGKPHDYDEFHRESKDWINSIGSEELERRLVKGELRYRRLLPPSAPEKWK